MKLEESLLEKPDRVVPTLLHGGRENRPTVCHESERAVPDAGKTGQGTNQNIPNRVGGIGPYVRDILSEVRPDTFDVGRAFDPLQFQVRPQHIGGRSDVTRGECIGDCTECGERVGFECFKQTFEVLDRLAGDTSRIEKVTTECGDRCDNKSKRREQHSDRRDDDADCTADE